MLPTMTEPNRGELSQQHSDASENRTAPRILVVDDHPAVLETTALLLSGAGYYCETAETAEAACEKIDTGRFQLVITDLELPGMRGEELLQLIAKEHSYIVSIVISGHHDSESIRSALHQNLAYEFLIKPVQEDVLFQVIERAFYHYEKKRKATMFREQEAQFYRDAVAIFDWRKEIQNRNATSIARNVIEQIAVGFFHGGGLGTMLSVLSRMFQRARLNAEQSNYEISPALFDLLKENYDVARQVTSNISTAQAILQENTEYTQTMTGGEIMQLVDSLIQELQPSLQIQQQRIARGELGKWEDCTQAVIFREDRMRSVLREVLINAMKYSRERDSIFIIPKVNFDAFELKILNPDYSHVDRKIPAIEGSLEYLIFEPFFRLNLIPDERYQNHEEFTCGLGLTIVRKIIEMHGGNVFVHTIPDHAFPDRSRDICLTIRLPLKDGPK